MENEKLERIGKDIKKEQVEAIREIVKMTFEYINDLEKEKAVIQEKMKILKHDLFDLKDGRLDRILERQNTNEACKSISVVCISKIVQAEAKNPWYEDYDLTFSSLIEGSDISEFRKIRLNNSITKTHAAGTYKLKDGTIRYL